MFKTYLNILMNSLQLGSKSNKRLVESLHGQGQIYMIDDIIKSLGYLHF